MGGRHPVVVVEDGNEVRAFAAASPYSDRSCYDGVAEFKVYVARRARGHRLGEVAMHALMDACREGGWWKLVSRVFPENTASLALLQRIGFRIVGTYERHGQLDGRWKDTVIVERLLT